VSFLAILELVKESLIELTQSEPFAPIHVRARGGPVEAAAIPAGEETDNELVAEVPATA
jgi:segregation and condensation protein A